MGSDSDLAAAGAGAGGGLRRVPGGGHHGPHHALPRRARAGLRADFGMNCDDIDEDAMMMTVTTIKMMTMMTMMTSTPARRARAGISADSVMNARGNDVAYGRSVSR